MHAKDAELAGVLAITPTKRLWRFASTHFVKGVHVHRYQIPLLPAKQCTLHGIQGNTADPGIVAHWKFPKRLGVESLWLAHYVILSRPRRLSNLLSFGLPDRQLLEAGPPPKIQEALERLFSEKIAKTREACVSARAELNWPPRRA